MQSPQPQLVLDDRSSKASEKSTDNDDNNQVIEDFLTGLSLLFLFLQYVGVIIVEDINLGVWGDSFGWLTFFSLSFNLDYSPEFLGAVVFAVLFYPFAINFLIKHFMSGRDREIKFDKEADQYFLYLTPFALPVSILVAVGLDYFDQPELATGVVAIGVYGILGYLYYFGQNGVFHRSTVIEILRYLTVFCYVPIASLANELQLISIERAEQGFPEDDSLIQVADLSFFIVLLVLVYLLAAAFQYSLVLRNSEYRRNHTGQSFDCVKCSCFCTCIDYDTEARQFIASNEESDIRPSRWLFPVYIVFERVSVAFIESDLFNGDIFNDTEIEANFNSSDDFIELDAQLFLLFPIFVFTILLVSIFRPFKEKKVNQMEAISRFFHILLIIVLFFEAELSLELLNILLFSISIITFIFWCIYLKPGRVYQALKMKKRFAGTTLAKTRARLMWHDIKNIETARNLLAKRGNNRKVTEQEWATLLATQKLFVLLADINQINDNVQVIEESIYKLTNYNVTVVNNGIRSLVNVTNFSLRNSGLKDEDCELILKENVMIYFRNLKIFNFSDNPDITVIGLNHLVQALKQIRSLETVKARGCNFNVECAVYFQQLLHDSTNICELDLSSNLLMTKGCAEIIMASSSLRILKLNDNFMTEISPIVLDALLENQVLTQLSVASNHLTEVNQISLIQMISIGQTVTLLHINSQKPSNLVASMLDENGNVLTSDLATLRSKQIAVSMSIRVLNEMTKALEINSKLSFDEELVWLTESLVVEKMFTFKNGIVTGFSKKLWKYLNDGLCCFVTTALSQLVVVDGQMEELLSKRNNRGQTALEAVIMNGQNNVVYCATKLVELGANLEDESANGTKTVLNLALEHTDKSVRNWANGTRV